MFWGRIPTLRKRIVIMVDDPWQLRVNVADVVTQLESGKLSTILIVGFRDSDTAVDPADLFIPGSPTSDFLVDHELDEFEIARLPDLLVRIGACKDEREAKVLVSRNPYRRASDILCSLWFLLPETRDQLQSSIEDEYRRLGDARAAIEATAATAGKQGELARSAYEAITVTSSLKIGLPIEVLVRALEVDYADWIAATKPGKPVWGLLYDEYEESSDSFTYRTRNEIVTDVLLRLVNGSLGGHSGQYRLLKQLILACTVASPPYRAFLHDVLVRSRDVLERILSFEQGMDLYNSANTVMPYPDRAIQHHTGLWIKNVGGDLVAADDQLRSALQVPDYPGASRDEPVEFIHTSLAANVLSQVKAGNIDPAAGFERVMEHLDRGSNPKFFSAQQSHIKARTLLEMAQIPSAAATKLYLLIVSAVRWRKSKDRSR